jgi:hypothetical protein
MKKAAFILIVTQVVLMCTEVHADDIQPINAGPFKYEPALLNHDRPFLGEGRHIFSDHLTHRYGHFYVNQSRYWTEIEVGMVTVDKGGAVRKPTPSMWDFDAFRRHDSQRFWDVDAFLRGETNRLEGVDGDGMF